MEKDFEKDFEKKDDPHMKDILVTMMVHIKDTVKVIMVDHMIDMVKVMTLVHMKDMVKVMMLVHTKDKLVVMLLVHMKDVVGFMMVVEDMMEVHRNDIVQENILGDGGHSGGVYGGTKERCYDEKGNDKTGGVDTKVVAMEDVVLEKNFFDICKALQITCNNC